MGRIDGVLLHKGLATLDALHELVGNLHADIGTGNLTLL